MNFKYRCSTLNHTSHIQRINIALNVVSHFIYFFRFLECAIDFPTISSDGLSGTSRRLSRDTALQSEVPSQLGVLRHERTGSLHLTVASWDRQTNMCKGPAQEEPIRAAGVQPNEFLQRLAMRLKGLARRSFTNTRAHPAGNLPRFFADEMTFFPSGPAAPIQGLW